jgi:hypothetical protein
VLFSMFLFISDWTGPESLITFDFLGEKNPESETSSKYVYDDMANQTKSEHDESGTDMRHDQNLLSVERIDKDRLGDSTQMKFREIKRLSETNICKIKMVVHQLFICDMQFKLVNSIWLIKLSIYFLQI